MINFYGLRYLLYVTSLALLLASSTVRAQTSVVPSTADTIRGMPGVALDSVLVAPSAIDTKGWLLLNKDIQTELDGAVHNVYNFKFDQADKQFRSLRRRYPNHPMPYFLLGLSTWWKIMPSNMNNEQYDKRFFAYLDTTITKAQRLYDADNNNYEASFFLSAAYGFDARLHAERHDWRKATVSSKRSLTYLQKSREANGLSPEFAFGEGLFNYYAVWIAEEYPLLRPVLLFFPKGNRATGLAQLNDVAQHGFYTAPEARFFQMRILGSAREQNTAAAKALGFTLSQEYPDNACFARTYAANSFAEGDFFECERISRDILGKLNKGQTGYEAFSGRAASYYMGYLMQNRYRNLSAARDYYQRCVVFSESVGQTQGGYYLFSLASLGRLAALTHDILTARRYYEQVLKVAERSSEVHKEARAYLRKNPATAALTQINLTMGS